MVPGVIAESERLPNWIALVVSMTLVSLPASQFFPGRAPAMYLAVPAPVCRGL